MKTVTTLILSAMLTTPALADEVIYMNCQSYEPRISDHPLAIDMTAKTVNGNPADFLPVEVTWLEGDQHVKISNFLNRLTGAYRQTTPNGTSFDFKCHVVRRLF